MSIGLIWVEPNGLRSAVSHDFLNSHEFIQVYNTEDLTPCPLIRCDAVLDTQSLEDRGGMGLIKVEPFLSRGTKQPFPDNVLVWVFRELEVVDARVDRRIGVVVSVHLADDGEARV